VRNALDLVFDHLVAWAWRSVVLATLPGAGRAGASGAPDTPFCSPGVSGW
jgi:hypothetical protein